MISDLNQKLQNIDDHLGYVQPADHANDQVPVHEAADSLLDAVRAVLNLHYAIESPIHPRTVCAHRYCKDDDLDQVHWPCPTVQAITKQMETER